MINSKFQPKFRYYVLLAINKKDPNDIYGCDYHGNWNSSYVEIHQAETISQLIYYKQKSLKRKVKTGFISHEQSIEESLNEDYSHNLHLSQNLYNYIKHGIRRVPDDYVVKVFRVGSKHCPIDVDLRYHIAVDLNKTDFFDKFKYFSAPFFVKAINTNFKWPDNYLKWIKDATLPFKCIHFSNLCIKICNDTPYSKNTMNMRVSRKKFQKLKKQRKNNLCGNISSEKETILL